MDMFSRNIYPKTYREESCIKSGAKIKNNFEKKTCYPISIQTLSISNRIHMGMMHSNRIKET